ncbi:hypothetical protein [Sphingobium indicum]|uniref:hypothetical protein n=1 Tax=Sphingobium indicum TaxID=332055 RepID=UPI0013E9C692|nr:hypothetical protein [Sphingobium indicum]
MTGRSSSPDLKPPRPAATPPPNPLAATAHRLSRDWPINFIETCFIFKYGMESPQAQMAPHSERIS